MCDFMLNDKLAFFCALFVNLGESTILSVTVTINGGNIQ